ncbi:MAG: Ribulose-phosphate 3-epimerase [Chloroflexi bacterium]|nr:Ribulose-phosphate 3-epimerase [Chloroflexota bacterium]
MKLAASILSADFGRLADQIRRVQAAGADYIHVDVMDGRFVPNITIGPLVVEAVRRVTDLPLDVHLMIEEPERYLADFVSAGASIVTVHQEACHHLQAVLARIRSLGVRSGVSICPSTPVQAVSEVVDDFDLLLVMTVNPGFGGQSLIPATIDKVRRARELLDAAQSAAELEVDGGVNASNAPALARAGAKVFVAGSAVFANGAIEGNIQRLREALAPVGTV